MFPFTWSCGPSAHSYLLLCSTDYEFCAANALTILLSLPLTQATLLWVYLCLLLFWSHCQAYLCLTAVPILSHSTQSLANPASAGPSPAQPMPSKTRLGYTSLLFWLVPAFSTVATTTSIWNCCRSPSLTPCSNVSTGDAPRGCQVLIPVIHRSNSGYMVTLPPLWTRALQIWAVTSIPWLRGHCDHLHL